MEYGTVVPGVFLRRPNRFIAHVRVAGREVVAHVPNTGRCRELLVGGAAVWLRPSRNPERKTAFSLVAVEKALPGGGSLLINMDAQAPNRAFEEAALTLLPRYDALRREVRFGASRFDFRLDGPSGAAFVEVKGVTLEEGGIARFPDAPTARGVKHIEELAAARQEGFEAYICFVIQMKGPRSFEPNDRTHPAFGAALRAARDAGVHILTFDCRVTPGGMSLDEAVEVVL